MANKRHRKLKSGFTTGTAAAAAAKAAFTCLVAQKCPQKVDIRLLTGNRLQIPVDSCRRLADTQAVCTVVKDAGDDPDVTHGARIGAIVTLEKHFLKSAAGVQKIILSGGQGVGRVTKPGLEVPVGEAAINPGPRAMIRQGLEEAGLGRLTRSPVSVEIFVPRGEALAKKTLNARLGIVGGISILGTTGVVKPMSHEAYIATIRASLDVALAVGVQHLVFTTGRRSERFAQKHWPRLPEEAFVQIGDFFKDALVLAAARGFEHLTLAVFFGKAVKMAQGVPHTHAAKSTLTLAHLSRWALELTGDRQLGARIAAANTARQAFDYLHPAHPQVIAAVGRKIVAAATAFAGEALDIDSTIFDFNGNIIYVSKGQR